MLKVFLITQNEPFYIPKMVKYLLDNQNHNYSIIGCTVLKPSRKNKTIFHWIKERIIIYNIKEFFIISLLFLYCKLTNKIKGIKCSYSVKNILRKYQICRIDTININSKDFIDKLGGKKPDIILSISCPQLFKEKILKLPSKYCLNAHGTLLPRHRGVFGSWWTLYSHDKEAGSTIHTMVLKLDAGEILWQKSFPIEDNDTQYSIAFKTKKQIAHGILELLNLINIGREEIILPRYVNSYHRAPNKKQGREFHKMDLRIIKFKDIPQILIKRF